MKLGLISDVHGNIVALEKVFEEFRKIGVDKVLCAGDIIGLGPYPEEAVQFLMKQDNIISVRGNHEGYLLDGIPKIIHARPMTEEETNHHKWIHNRLSEESIKYLDKIPKIQTIDFAGKKIFMAHYPISKFGIYKEFIKAPSLEQSERLFDDVDADICIYGHTHIFSKNKDDKKMYLNLEALGCPVGTGLAKAGILNFDDENVEYEAINVPYDVEKVKDEIKELKYSFYESVIRIFYDKKGELDV